MKWYVDIDGFTFDFNVPEEDSDYIQHNKIEELVCVDRAKEIDDGKYLISHENIAKLTKEERALLGLPRIFPYQLRLRMYGALTDNNMRYFVEYIRPDGRIFISPKVMGSYIKISTELDYTFNLGQYFIVNKTDESNKKLQSLADGFDYVQYNFLNLADIKEAADYVGADLDKEIRAHNIVVPKSLNIIPTYESNGDITINPIIIDGNGDYIPSYDDFNKRFNLKREVKSIYTNGSEYYVIPNKLKQALEEVKANKRIRSKEVKKFLANPSAVFTSDCFVFNIDEYSDRVINYGEYKYKTESGGTSGIEWLPPEGASPAINGQKAFKVTADNAKEVDGLINKAREEGKNTIVIDNEEIPITIDIEEKARKYLKPKEERKNKEENENEKGVQGNDAIKKHKRDILIIADNFENINYGNTIQNRMVTDTDFSQCLTDGIKLLSHQREGVQWLLDRYKYDDGALLADDMGLGKTLQTLTFLALYKKSSTEDVDSALIVAPVSLLNNWVEEYHKFIKKDIFDGIEIIDGKSVEKYKVGSNYDFKKISKNHVVVISYDTLRIHQLSLGKIQWGVMVLDEAQKIKNPTSLTTLAVKAMKYDFGLCLTGTPIENTWVDLWSIMDFVSPGGKLGSLSDFREEFVHKLKRKNSSEMEIVELGQKLNETLQPLFKRRMKEDLCNNGGDLADLPQKNIHKSQQIMPTIQKNAYLQVIDNAKHNVDNKAMALNVIGQLRDVSLYPDIASLDERQIDKINPADIFNTSARLKATYIELVNIAYKKEKVLIFAESKKMQRILKVVIERNFQIKVPQPINGDMLAEYRQKIVNQFNQQEGFGVLILSPLAAGAGLNIASANHVIHLSRHWNPAKEDQATDRAYRIGQTKDVEVCIPMAVHSDLGDNGSFDQKLDQLLEYKRQLSRKVLIPTADSEEDGLAIFKDIVGGAQEVAKGKDVYYDLNGIDRVNGTFFEKIITRLYENMGYEAEKTPDSNDNGADVIAISKTGSANYLIQCKKTGNVSSNIGKDGVQEIASASPYYQKKYNQKFQTVVITNSVGFTEGAKSLAKANGVLLIARQDLDKLLKQYPVEKIYV